MATIMPRCILLVAKRKTICPASVAVPICHYSSQPRIIKDPTTAALKRGTGGRSSFNGIVCTVFGCTGFIGRYVVNRLGRIGTQIILPNRGDVLEYRNLKVYGDLGQVLFHPIHLRDEESLIRSMKYSNVVINLIGREHNTRNFSLHDVNVEGARTIARLAKQCGVERLIHVSCLNAHPNPKPLFKKEGSIYYKTKWEGEQAVKEEFPEATIIKPSVVYGQEDRFLRTYVHRWRRHLGYVPVWENAEKTEVQPIWVGDVAAGIVATVKDRDTAGKTYQFVGPKRYQLSELIDYILNSMIHNRFARDLKRVDIKYLPLFRLKLFLTENFFGHKPFGTVHSEGIEKEHTSDRVEKGLPSIEDLGIIPQEIEKRMAWEVYPYRLDNFYVATRDEFPKVPLPKTIPIH